MLNKNKTETQPPQNNTNPSTSWDALITPSLERASEQYGDEEEEFAEVYGPLWDKIVEIEKSPDFNPYDENYQKLLERYKKVTARAESIIEAKWRTIVDASQPLMDEARSTFKTMHSARQANPRAPMELPVGLHLISCGDTNFTVKTIASQNIGTDPDSNGLSDPEASIESATGIFFNDRSIALAEAIRSSDLPEEEKQSDLDLLSKTFSVAESYFELYNKEDTINPESEDAIIYDKTRGNHHQAMVKQLNAINTLAEKYETKRFTPRGFMENPTQKFHKGDLYVEALDSRSSYDRYSVVGYFKRAFSTVRDQERKRAHKSDNKLAFFHDQKTSGLEFPDHPELGY